MSGRFFVSESARADRVGQKESSVAEKESVPHGLRSHLISRIDLAEFVTQLPPMGDVAILFQTADGSSSTADAWLARAARMQRIAMLLPVKDAQVLKAYAAECEVEARRATQMPGLKIAA
jgi:hypothetical protein